jgi:lipoate-protein ligase A
MLTIIIYLLFLAVMVYWLGVESKFEFKLLNLNDHPGRELEDWLKRFNWDRSNLTSSAVQLPRYKFYSEVVETLLSLARKMGGKYQDALFFLRQGLQADLQSEKKLKELEDDYEDKIEKLKDENFELEEKIKELKEENEKQNNL